jgi:hypothetical protein
MCKKVLATDSGMWGIWDYYTYSHIDSYEDWDKIFYENINIEKQIVQNTFVPINIRQDGSFEFQVKINDKLDNREEKYLLVKSKPYLFQTAGKIKLCGIEKIEKNIKENDCLTLDIEKGKYTINICLIQWDQEPNMRLENGTPKPNALPDFIVLINSVENENIEYNKNIETFKNNNE